MRVDTLTPVVPASPGESARCRVRVTNDGDTASSYRVRVVGVEGNDLAVPLAGPIPPGHATDVDVHIDVPGTFAAGNHTVALEVTSTTGRDRPLLTDLTLSVDSTEQVVMRIAPARLSGRRKRKFRVLIDNRDIDPADLRLMGSGTDLDVRLEPSRIVLHPGQRAVVRGRVKGPRLSFSDPIDHVLTVEARGGMVPVYATATYHQKPSFPIRLRTAVAVLCLLSLWVAVAAGAVLYFHNQDAKKADKAAVATKPAGDATDTSGDGTSTDSGTATDGSGGAGGAGGAAGGGGGGAAGGGGKDTAVKPTITLINGTVKAGKTGADQGITVTLKPREVDTPAPPPGTKIIGSRRGLNATKLWIGRTNRYRGTGLPAARETTSVQFVTGGEGTWAFPDVAIRDTYELNFSKPGFDPQSFIITPTPDGKPVEIKVDLQPASGKVTGVIVGPDGAGLGDVDISVSDGKATYEAVSSTVAGAVGTFTIDGIGTPAKYVLTAARRGYGTEVVQIPMDPGQTRKVQVRMAAGVGSVNGSVTVFGVPKGAVTITATSGDVERSTSSLTEGVVGSYNIPQLPIPGEYTITASAPGFISQTRLVSLNGNQSAVDFDLVKSTGTITGLVVSDKDGPEAGVGITIFRDKLVFKTITASAPDHGSFTVEDLPPGEYVVSFFHFEHRDASRIVTVGAGQVLDMGQVPMAFVPEGPQDRTGSMSVSVFKSDGNELTGATVSLIDITDGLTKFSVANTADDTSAFFFDEVPVGTYTVKVDRSLYQTVTQRVSVGLGAASVTVNLLKLGQASGVLVDSLTKQPLEGYSITVQGVTNDGTPQGELFQISVPTGFLARGEIPKWRTPADKLLPGLYTVRVSIPPQGYRVLADQSLSTLVGTKLMTFLVPEDSEQEVAAGNIEADPYPIVTGHVWVPVLNAGGVTVSYNEVGAAPSVALECPDISHGGYLAPIPATITDDLDPKPSFDTFTFTKQQLSTLAPNLGACRLTISGVPGYQTSQFTVSPDLAPSNGLVSADRSINVALVPPATPIGNYGKVFWYDHSASASQHVYPLGTATVTSSPGSQIIVGFSPGTGGPDDKPDPVFSPIALTALSNVDGMWTLDGQAYQQVFGATKYIVTHASSAQGEFTLTIANTGRTVTAGPGVTLRPDLAGLDPNSIQLEVVPNPGSLSGTVNLLTTATPNYAGVGVGVTSPFAVVTAPALASSVFSVSPAAAGTWRVRYTAPPHYVAIGATDVTQFVGPAETKPGFDATFYELGDLHVGVTDSAGVPLAATVTLAHTTTGLTGDPATSSSAQAVDSHGVHDFIDLPVNSNQPAITKAAYTISTEVAGYDASLATVTIVDGSGTRSQFGAASIPIDLLAGTNASVTIQLPKFGVLGGSVVADVGDATEPFPADAVVTVQRMFDIGGNAVTEDAFCLGTAPVSEPPCAFPTGYLSNVDGSRFSFTGKPGYYSIAVKHPFFETSPSSVPTSSTEKPGYYKLTNDGTTPVGAFHYRILRGQLDVSAVTAAVGGANVVGARLEIPRPGSAGANDVITAKSHGLVAGDLVYVEPPAAGSLPGGLSAGIAYFVIATDLTTDGFALGTSGGAPIDITSAGSLVWIHPVPVRATGGTTVEGTASEATNLISAPSHGLLPGDRVEFSGVPLLDFPGGLSPGVPYIVIAAGLTADEFAVSLLVEGPAVDITTDGSLAWPTAPSSHAIITDLVPGTYPIRLSALNAAGQDVYFPVALSITVHRGATLAQRTATLFAVMPPIGGGITGRIVAVNSAGKAVGLPASVTIDRTGPNAQSVVDASSVANGPGEADLTPVPSKQQVVHPGAPAGTPQTFLFNGLVAGSHKLKFSTESGYTSPSPDERSYTVTGITPFPAGDLTYTARDRRVLVRVLSTRDRIAVTNATVTLTSDTSPARTYTGVLQNTGLSGTYAFAAVPPEMTDYKLTVDAPLHTDLLGVDAVSETIRPSADDLPLDDVILAPDLGRISGIVEKQASAGQSSAAASGVTVNLYRPSGNLLGAIIATTTTLGDGSYRFDVDQAGNYAVVGTLTDYASRQVSFSGVLLGAIKVPDPLVLPKLATVNFIISTSGVAPDPANVTITTTPSDPTFVVPATTRVTNTLTIAGLDPDLTYSFLLQTPNWYDGTVVPSGSDPAIGGSKDYNVAFVQRVVKVTVNIAGGDNGDEETATVTLRIPAGTGTEYTPTSSSGHDYFFRNIPDGAGEITVAHAGYLDQVVSLGEAPNAHAQENLSATLFVRTLDVVVNNADGSAAPSPSITVDFGGGTTFDQTDATVSGGTYTFSGVPGAAATISVSVAGRLAIADQSIGSVTCPCIAEDVTQTKTFVAYERTLAVNVSTEGANTTVDKTVDVVIGASTPTLTKHGTEPTAFSFGSLPAGTGTVTVSATGYRSQTVDLTDVTTPSVAQTKSVSLKLLATISGVVRDDRRRTAPLGSTVTLDDPTTTASPDFSVTTNSDGHFDAPGLWAATWTIAADVAGYGSVSTTRTITATEASAITLNLSLVARSRVYTFHVVNGSSPSTPGMNSVLIQFSPVISPPNSGTTATVDTVDGVVAITTDENKLDWVIAHTGYITASGTAPLASGPIDVTLYLKVVLSGRLVDSNASGVGNQDLYLCSATVTPLNCTSASAARLATVTTSNTTGSVGTFTLPALDRGNYILRSDRGSKDPYLTFTVTSAGLVTPVVSQPDSDVLSFTSV